MQNKKTAEQKRRRELLLVHLNEVKRRDPGSFDMTSWFTARKPSGQIKETMQEWPRRWAAGEALNCNTTACIVGHLPLVFPDDWAWGASRHLPYCGFVGLRSTAGSSNLGAGWGDTDTAAQQLNEFFGGEPFDWVTIIQPLSWRWRRTKPTLENVITVLQEFFAELDAENTPNP